MNSTIQISKDVKDKIKSFGSKDETYEEIITKLYDIAVKQQLREFLMSSDDTVTLEEARKRIDE